MYCCHSISVCCFAGELTAKRTEATAAVATATKAKAQLETLSKQAKGLQSQFNQTQQALENMRQQRSIEESKAIADATSLTRALKAQDLELTEVREALSTAQARLQGATAGMAGVTGLQEQVARLQAELTAEEAAHCSLKQQHADSLQEATNSASTLTAVAEAKALELEQHAASTSEREAKLVQLKALLKEAEDQVSVSQTTNAQLQSKSKSLKAKLVAEEKAHNSLKQHHADSQQQAASLSAAAVARALELDKVTASLSERDNSLVQLRADAQVRATASQAKVTELQTHSHSLHAELTDQLLAFSRLEAQHSELQQAAAAQEASIASAVQSKDSELQQATKAAASTAASLQQATAAHQASQNQIVSLEAAVENPMKRCECLQQQLSNQQQAHGAVNQQHASVQETLTTTEADSAVALSSEVSYLKEALATKEAKLAELYATKAASYEQVRGLQSVAQELPQEQQAHDADWSTPDVADSAVTFEVMYSADKSIAPEVMNPANQIEAPEVLASANPADTPKVVDLGESNYINTVKSKDQTGSSTRPQAHHFTQNELHEAASAGVKQIQQLQISQKKQYTELRQQHRQLQHENQTSTAALTAAAESVTKLRVEAEQCHQLQTSLTHKDAVIQQLKSQLAESTRLPPADRSVKQEASVSQDAVEGHLSDTQQLSLDTSITSGKEGICNLSSLAASANSKTTFFDLPTGLTSTGKANPEAASIPVSHPVAGTTAATSLSMPEGSVHNPLAQQPDFDDDPSLTAMRPLSPQVSTLELSAPETAAGTSFASAPGWSLHQAAEAHAGLNEQQVL